MKLLKFNSIVLVNSGRIMRTENVSSFYNNEYDDKCYKCCINFVSLLPDDFYMIDELLHSVYHQYRQRQYFNWIRSKSKTVKHIHEDKALCRLHSEIGSLFIVLSVSSGLTDFLLWNAWLKWRKNLLTKMCMKTCAAPERDTSSTDNSGK
jgi:hypothetical protein